MSEEDMLDQYGLAIMELTDDLANSKERIDSLVESLHRILNAIPAQDGNGGFIVDHHGLNGEYLGTEEIHPIQIVQEIDSIARAAISGSTATIKANDHQT